MTHSSLLQVLLSTLLRLHFGDRTIILDNDLNHDRSISMLSSQHRSQYIHEVDEMASHLEYAIKLIKEAVDLQGKDKLPEALTWYHL